MSGGDVSDFVLFFNEHNFIGLKPVRVIDGYTVSFFLYCPLSQLLMETVI